MCGHHHKHRRGTRRTLTTFDNFFQASDVFLCQSSDLADMFRIYFQAGPHSSSSFFLIHFEIGSFSVHIQWAALLFFSFFLIFEEE